MSKMKEMERVTEASLSRPCSFQVQALALVSGRGPFNLRKIVPGNDFPGTRLGFGPAQVVLQTELSSSVDYHLTSLSKTIRALEERHVGLTIKFVPRLPTGMALSGGMLWQSGYLEALKLALSEPGEGGRGVINQLVNLGDVCFSSLRISTAGLSDETATQMCNLLTLATPSILEFVHERYGIKHSRINSVHLGYAHAHRLPGNWWFTDASAYKVRFESLPRLVSEFQEGVWVVPWQEMQSLGKLEDEKVTWWLARRLTRCQVIEYRALPSLQPQYLLELTPIILKWLEQALESLGDERFESGTEAGESGLIPDFEGRKIPPPNWELEYLRY